MKRVFICSRYAGDIKKNVETAKQLCRKATGEGLAPFAPHLLYTLFLNDDEPAEKLLADPGGEDRADAVKIAPEARQQASSVKTRPPRIAPSQNRRPATPERPRSDRLAGRNRARSCDPL